MEKFNAKSAANKLIAEHLEKLEAPDATKLRTTLKISQNDAVLTAAYVTLMKAELGERFSRVKVSKKSKALAAGKETPESK
jgi:hypothetical protein